MANDIPHPQADPATPASSPTVDERVQALVDALLALPQEHQARLVDLLRPAPPPTTTDSPAPLQRQPDRSPARSTNTQPGAAPDGEPDPGPKRGRAPQNGAPMPLGRRRMAPRLTTTVEVIRYTGPFPDAFRERQLDAIRGVLEWAAHARRDDRRVLSTDDSNPS